jgi:predicted ArsR family transcriptional regulator
LTKPLRGRIFEATTVVSGIATGEITIITVDQLPDSRRAILLALKREGPSTIARLAAELQLTGEAVRQQLLQLQREGWIEAKIAREQERGRTGRPATRYSLTEAGDHLFPKNYDLLNVAVLDAVTDELGPEAAVRVLRRVTDERVHATEAQVQGRSLEERVNVLRSLYFESDPYMDVETAEDGFYLVERNCPYYNTAMRRPILCNVSINALTRLLGVRVEREERFQHGDGRCVFHVHADEPVESAEFRLEEGS